jgi:hypothetical protein
MMFRYIFLVLSTISLSTFVVAQKNGNVWEITKSRGIHRVRIVVQTKPFNAKEHQIKKVFKRETSQTSIDGKLALGTDATLPRREITSFRLTYDGHDIQIPRSLYADCYDPNLDKKSFWVKFADDGESVMAFMAGSDGAGGYQVFWILRKDGRHTRFSNAVSDANYPDFANWFFEN